MKRLILILIAALTMGCSASTMEYLTREPTLDERVEKLERCNLHGGHFCSP